MNAENSKWTVCEKTAWISSDIFGFSSAIQAFGLERFRKNASKACKGYEYVLDKMFTTPAIAHHTHSENLKERALKVAQKAKEKAKEKAQHGPLLGRTQTS
jgi:hypothetical protein